MLYYNKILESEGIDIEKNKNSDLRKCEICQFWFFIKENFKFQQYLCDGCHDLSMLAYNLSKSAIFKIGEYHYRYYFEHMTKDDTRKKLENVEFNLVDIKGYA